MIVAHPDDETIFGYSQLRHEQWYVVCATNGDNLMRSREFAQAMDSLGHHYELWTFKDEWNGIFDPLEVGQRLQDVLRRGSFTKIVTHNEDGEYGHTQHKSLHHIVKKNVSKELLWVFNPEESYLHFDVLTEKLRLLQSYQSQYELGLFQWHEQGNPNNCMMKYVVHEGIRKL